MFDSFSYLIPDSLESSLFFFVYSLSFCRVIKSSLLPFYMRWCHCTAMFCIYIKRNNHCCVVQNFHIYWIGFLIRNIKAHSSHCLDCTMIQPMGFFPSTVTFPTVSRIMFSTYFLHLTTAGVSCTEKVD